MSLLVCPNCNVSMQAVQRVGVELDICPQCRSVWLDRGELEKILDQERARLNEEIARAPRPAPWSGHDDHDDHHGHGAYRKKRSIFDIFD
jgi:Zn-finger nucleic acid-binding protein